MGAVKRRTSKDAEIINAVSGALAGALTATFVCPLDVLKTRLQVQRLDASNHGIVGGLTRIARENGIRGLYQGLGPTLVALLPNWAVYFTVYDSLKHKFANANAIDGQKARSTPLSHMAAAAGAGMSTLLVTNPLWVVKTRMQTQNMRLDIGKGIRSPPYSGTMNALLRISREEGFRGLYSGLAPSMMGILHVAIQFPLYEFLKTQIAEHKQTASDNLRPSELVVASAVSKMVASTVTYPHEVVRSYMHVTGSGPLQGLLSGAQTIMREDGIKGFYRGCATNLLRTTPAAALTFTSFELIARGLRKMSVVAEDVTTGDQAPASAPANSIAWNTEGSTGRGREDSLNGGSSVQSGRCTNGDR